MFPQELSGWGTILHMEGEEPSAPVEGEFAPLFGQSGLGRIRTGVRSNTDRRPVEHGGGRSLQTHGALPLNTQGAPLDTLSGPLIRSGRPVKHRRRPCLDRPGGITHRHRVASKRSVRTVVCGPAMDRSDGARALIDAGAVVAVGGAY